MDNSGPLQAVAAVRAKLTLGEARLPFVEEINEEPLKPVFPLWTFIRVSYPRYPRAMAPPGNLKATNLCAVDSKNEVVVMSSEEDAAAFLSARIQPATTDELAKSAVLADICLKELLNQDGYFGFSLVEEATTVEQRDGRRTAFAKSIVVRGGNGEIVSQLVFDEKGTLVACSGRTLLRSGPRPICQATKLLDSDPIVRLMAEQDLFCMGRFAKPYLDEQRFNASPALKRAIDSMWKKILETPE